MTISKDIWADMISSKKEIKEREQTIRMVDKVTLKVESTTAGTELVLVSFYITKNGIPEEIAKKSLESNDFFQAVIGKQRKTGKFLRIPLSRVPKSSYDPIENEEFIPVVLWNPIRKFFGIPLAPSVVFSFFTLEQDNAREAGKQRPKVKNDSFQCVRGIPLNKNSLQK